MYFKMKTRHSDTLLKFGLLESPRQESCFCLGVRGLSGQYSKTLSCNNINKKANKYTIKQAISCICPLGLLLSTLFNDTVVVPITHG